MEKHYVLIMAPEGISILRCKMDLIEMLVSKGAHITHVRHWSRRIDVETDHVAVRIIPYNFKDFDGMRYDECFGVPMCTSCTIKKNGISGRQLIDAPDYICKIEREASVDSIGDITKKAFYELFEKYIRLHNIPAQFHRDYENGREYRLIIQHQYKSDTAIHILWDEVKDIDELRDAVIGELKKWPYGFRGTVAINKRHKDHWEETSESRKAREIGEALTGGYALGMKGADKNDVCELRVADMYPKTLYISTAGTDYNPFYKLFMNSVYGASFNNQMVYVSGRGNGKSTLSAERISKMIAEEADFTVQQQLYAALTKGEINMPTKKEEFVSYCRSDVESTAALYAAMRGVSTRKDRSKLPAIKTVHFSGPVTAVIWEDGTKTLVRCKDGEVPDYEKGFAMAIAKKAMGTNKSGSNYYDIFKKYLPKPEEETDV